MNRNLSTRSLSAGLVVFAVLLLVSPVAAQSSEDTEVSDATRCENYDPDWSPNGPLIAFVRDCGGNADIYLVDADGSNLVRLTETPGREGGPAWSPDGSRLAYTYAPEGGDREIRVMEADGSDAHAVTDNEFSESGPTWSPDGTRLAYASLRNDNADIWVLNLTSGVETRLTTSPARDVAPSWSPDGTTIAFQSKREGRYEIYGVRPDGDGTRLILSLPGDAVIPDWSPDGSRLAFAYQPSGENDTDIWLAGADGEDPISLTSNERLDFFPKWSSDGHTIAFMVRDESSWDIFVVSADGGDERRLLRKREQ